MIRSPIEQMIDAVAKCTRCGAGMGQCDCWSEVELRCPKCKRTMKAARDKTDPPGTAVVETQCPECVGGDFGEALYFDAAGKQLSCE